MYCPSSDHEQLFSFSQLLSFFNACKFSKEVAASEALYRVVLADVQCRPLFSDVSCIQTVVGDVDEVASCAAAHKNKTTRRDTKKRLG